MSLPLKGKFLIKFLLKNPQTVQFKKHYYKFSYKYRGPISLDDFYIFCLNYTYIMQSPKDNKSKFHEYIFLKDELENCLKNLVIKPGEQCLLPQGSFLHFYGLDTLDLIKSFTPHIKFKNNIIKNINKDLFLHTAFLGYILFPFKPLENITFFKRPNKNSQDVTLNKNFKFNAYKNILKIFKNYCCLEIPHISKNAFILACVRNESTTHQKIFEHFIFSHLRSSNNFTLSNKTLRLLKFFLRKGLLSEDDFYNKPVFLLNGIDSPLNSLSIIHGKEKVFIKDDFHEDFLYPYTTSIFHLSNYLPIREITLSHIFCHINYSLSNSQTQLLYIKLLNLIDFSKMKYGSEFLLAMLNEINSDNLHIFKDIINKNKEFLISIVFDRRKQKPKIKDKDILILSPLFIYLINEKIINITPNELETIINNLNIKKEQNTFKNKKLVLFHNEHLEEVETLLLKMQMKEDTSIKFDKKETKKIKKF